MAKRNQFKRPYTTLYYHGPNDEYAAHATHGACASEQGAIRASIVRVFLGQYTKAVIYDRTTGVAIYNVKRASGGLRVDYGSGVSFKEHLRHRSTFAG